MRDEALIVSAEERIRRGELLLQGGQQVEALAIADAVLAESSELASAWLLRGAACRMLLRYAEAAECFRIILALFPDFNQMRLNLASAYVELGAHEEAEIQLQEVVARDPDCAAAHAYLGSLYIRIDRYDLAESPTRRALALDPNIITASQNLAAILALRDDPDAKTHRDTAYLQQQVFIEPSPGADRTVLILTGSGSGNVPYLHLLPRERYKRVLWHVSYAPPGQQRDLPPYDFVFNAVGDPDAAWDAQIAARRFAETCPRPLLNHPDHVARTLRSRIPELLDNIPGTLIPKTLRLRPVAEDATRTILASGLCFPLILRPVGRHGSCARPTICQRRCRSGNSMPPSMSIIGPPMAGIENTA
jgi:hypothetical protein